MKKVITTILVVVGLIYIGISVWFYPVNEIKTAEVVKTEKDGSTYTYEEFEQYNIFGVGCHKVEFENWSLTKEQYEEMIAELRS